MSKYISAEVVKVYMFEAYPLLQREYLINAINGMPAADVAEVRHGRWENDGHTLACSNCHTINLRGVAWNYCPNCGSRMDLDEVEE